MLVAIAPSLTPPPAASRICARFTRRTACLPPFSIAASVARSGWLSSTRYRTFIAVPPLSRALMDRVSGDSRPNFTPKQGQYLAFIHAYTLVLGRPPAHADLLRHFRVTPPSVNQMLITLERQGLIRRHRGVARSIELLIDPSTLPQLRPSPGQPVKTTVQRY